MADHTPTPWNHFAEDLRGGKYWCVSSSDQCVIDGMHETENGEANAAFIVKAVNSHDANEAKIKALVKALRACRDELVLVQNGSTGGIPNAIMALIPERIAEADAALALCEQDR